MNWLLNRLKEKSTWLAIFTLAGLFGMKIEPELREYIINAILAVAAVVAFIFREEAKHEAAFPPIELQGRPESSQGCDPDAATQPSDSDIDLPVSVDERDLRLRSRSVSSGDRPQKPESVVRDDSGSGYNG
jgi:hypothetical protein